MKFIELTIKNFRCYTPEVKISLQGKANRPVATFVGYNGAGKTSIFLAVMWVLYGEAAIIRYTEGRKQDTQAPKNDFDLINLNVRDNSPLAFMRVSLVFEHDGSKYLLSRSVSSKYSNPKSERDLKPEDITLKKDGSLTEEHDPQSKINDILPFNAFQFFFFDGEDVKRYSGASNELTRTAIEQVLGIPEVRDAQDDLSKAERELLKQMSESKGIDDDFKNLTTALADNEDDIEERTKTINTKEWEKNKIDTELRDEEGARERVKEIQEFNEKLEALGRERSATEIALSEATNSRDELVKNLPYFLIKGCLRNALETYRKKAGADDLSSSIVSTKERIKLIDELIDAKTEKCVCGASLGESQIRQLQVVKKHYLENLNSLNEQASRKTVPPVEDIQYALGRVDGTQVDFEAHQKKINDLRADMVNFDDQIRGVETKIKGTNIEGAKTIQEHIDQLRQKKGSLEAEVRNLREQLYEMEKKKTTQQLQIAKLRQKKGQISDVSARYDLAKNAATAFDWIVQELIVRKKKAIMDNASEFFSAVTSGEDWKGIKIDDDYSIWLIDNKERSVLPAEGYKELVALSFIYGLNKAAAYNAPVLMDFVLGRLDEKHQKAVVSRLSDFSDQVLIFLLDSELNSPNVRKGLESIKSFDYYITKDNITGNSIVEERKV